MAVLNILGRVYKDVPTHFWKAVFRSLDGTVYATILLYRTHQTCRIVRNKPVLSYATNLSYRTQQTCRIVRNNPVIAYAKDLSYRT